MGKFEAGLALFCGRVLFDSQESKMGWFEYENGCIVKGRLDPMLARG